MTTYLWVYVVALLFLLVVLLEQQNALEKATGWDCYGWPAINVRCEALIPEAQP